MYIRLMKHRCRSSRTGRDGPAEFGVEAAEDSKETGQPEVELSVCSSAKIVRTLRDEVVQILWCRSGNRRESSDGARADTSIFDGLLQLLAKPVVSSTRPWRSPNTRHSHAVVARAEQASSAWSGSFRNGCLEQQLFEVIGNESATLTRRLTEGNLLRELDSLLADCTCHGISLLPFMHFRTS